MRIPDPYLVDGGNAYWLAPSYDYFGDPDVELVSCEAIAGAITFADASPIDFKRLTPEDAAYFARIDAALRAIALGNA
jgi:hypothetical protein